MKLNSPTSMRAAIVLFCLAMLPAFASALSSTNNCRRKLLAKLASSSAAIFLTAPSIASAGLLDEYGADPSKIQEKEVAGTTFKSSATKQKEQSSIEPNLRSNYYYPTNKVRYLPRIKKCSDAIPIAAVSIGDADWDAVEDFCLKIADDTVLPMKLYTSSLVGGGTNVKVSYVKDMNKCADEFDKYKKKLLVAVLRKDSSGSSQALEKMASAMQEYRSVGNLLGPDGGGDIPSVDEIRRAASRTTGRLYEKTVQARDKRIQS